MDDEDVYTSLMKNFEFSYWEENSSFHYATPVQKTNDGTTYSIFSTSNQGVALYQQFPVPEQYPTYAIEHNDGFAAKMITKEGPGSILGILHSNRSRFFIYRQNELTECPERSIDCYTNGTTVQSNTSPFHRLL